MSIFSLVIEINRRQSSYASPGNLDAYRGESHLITSRQDAHKALDTALDAVGVPAEDTRR